MKKYKGGGILTLLLEIIGLLIIVVGAYLYLRTNSNVLDDLVQKNDRDNVTNVITSGKCGLTITSQSPNSLTSFPLVIKGLIDNTNSQDLGCSWQMFEGQAGNAQLYSKTINNDWKKIGVMMPVIVENWTSNKTIFSVGLNFNNEDIGLSDGTLLKVVFIEENASGIPPVDTYEFPLVFSVKTSGTIDGTNGTGSSIETISLNLYIQDKEIAKTKDCGVTKKVIYQVPKTSAVADASLKILFANELSQYGVYKSVVVSNGLARITLASSNTPSGRPISGLSSCESSHLMSVLQDTLTQYSSIKKVEIYSPKGKIEF